MRKRKKRKPRFFETAIARVSVLNRNNKEEGLQFLVQFVNEIRPGTEKGKHSAEKNLTEAIGLLQQYPLLLKNLQHALFSQLNSTDLTSAITESGIPLARGFWQELSNRLKHKLLPPLQNENDFLFVINRIFFRKNDIDWVEQISQATWISFFEFTGLPFDTKNNNLVLQLLNSLKILSFQVAQLGLEKEIAKYIPETTTENPFVLQNYLIRNEERLMLAGGYAGSGSPFFSETQQIITGCETSIEYIRENLSERGASLTQTYIVLILQSRLSRMSILLDVLDRNHQINNSKLVDFFRLLIRYENRKNSIREFLSQGVGNLAYRIAEHKGSKGDKYITSTRSEYFAMIGSAMWGGFIISFIAVFKNLLSKLVLAPFWQGFFYSVNYSIGFIAIDQSNSTLATKQPAFTASTVAASLDIKKNNTQPNLFNLAELVGKVSRSQIASFFGNLIVVFPFTFLLSWIYQLLTGVSITTKEAAFRMLNDQHPWYSLSLLYACFTGFFLFLSGIIAGYVQNKIQYAQISQRLMAHPLLKVSLPAKRLEKFANFIEKNAGSLVGNSSLGFFLGMSGLLSKIFGIPFDIRHITIAAGNCGIAVYELGIDSIPTLYLLTVFIGVLGIGFLNFLVSFSLAFMVALKSRGIHLRDSPEFIKILWNYFKKNPRDFILPPKIQHS